MRPTENIEKLIKNTNIETNATTDKAVLGDIVKAFEESKKLAPSEVEGKESAITQPNIWRIIMKSKIVKLTAAVVVFVIGLFFLIGDGQQTLYAQILKALEQVRTLHAVIKEYRDGQWFKDHEIWYDREAGIMEQKRYESRTDVRIDNGKYELRYAVGEELVMKLNSYEDKDELARTLAEWFRYNPNRVPSGDLVIDDIPCMMYVISTNEVNKISIWVDDKSRVRKMEQINELQNKKIRTVGIIEYDIVIDRTLFVPDFGPDTQFINPREWIERQYPLETAIFTRESLGFVFSVHEVKVCENNIKFIVCSTRLTAKTRREISNGHPWTYYGHSSLFDNYQSESYYDHPMLLARLSHDGMQVEWYLLIPIGNQANKVVDCNVDVVINTANQLEQKCKEEGLPITEKFNLNIKKQQFEEDKTSISEISSKIYSIGKKLSPIVHSFLLTEVVQINAAGAQTQAWRKPAIEISEEDYLKNVEKRVHESIGKNQ